MSVVETHSLTPPPAATSLTPLPAGCGSNDLISLAPPPVTACAASLALLHKLIELIGEAIGKAVEKCLLEWGITKVMTITVDNASSNDVGVQYLRKRLLRWKDGTVSEDVKCIMLSGLLMINNDSDKATQLYDIMMGTLTSLHEHYAALQSQNVSSVSENIDLTSKDFENYNDWNDVADYEFERNIGGQIVFDKKSDLDKYLMDDREPNIIGKSFDALGWWKKAIRLRFPSLMIIFSIRSYFKAVGVAGVETVNSIFLGLLGRCQVSAGAAVRVIYKVIGEGGGSGEGVRIREIMAEELVSDERVVTLFAGEKAAKERTTLHAVLWN
uniref:HAT C-terminal dimerisation domain-containing protein n=1 Tax=Chenopodium quinoa TaxID=63459 RepID=A0A803KN13_CHEQI